MWKTREVTLTVVHMSQPAWVMVELGTFEIVQSGHASGSSGPPTQRVVG